jgi:hypothetical protein
LRQPRNFGIRTPRVTRRARIILCRVVNWGCRQAGLAAEAHSKCVDRGDILAVLSRDNRGDCAIRILVCFRSRFLNTLNFLLARGNIQADSVLSLRDVARSVIAPGDRISKLLLMLLHRSSRSVDRRTRRFRGIARPNVRTIEYCGLLTLPLVQSRGDR